MSEKDKEILIAAKKIESSYATKFVDEEEESLTFIDEVNKLLQTIFKDNPTDVYTALTPGKLEIWKKNRWRRLCSQFMNRETLQKFFYFALLATITAFLVSEALPFYAIGGVVEASTYVKAILTEVCFIFLNGYRSIGKLQIAAVSALRVSIFVLMMFVITSKVVFESAENVSEISNVQSQIELLVDDIAKKEVTIEFYRKKNWGVNVRIQEEARDKLRDKLLELRTRQLETKKSEAVSDLIVYKAWGRAAFRMLLLLVSILISRRLFKF